VAHVALHEIVKADVSTLVTRQQTCPPVQSAASSHSCLFPLQVAVDARQVLVAVAPEPTLQHSFAGTAHSALLQLTNPGSQGKPSTGPPGQGVPAELLPEVCELVALVPVLDDFDSLEMVTLPLEALVLTVEPPELWAEFVVEAPVVLVPVLLAVERVTPLLLVFVCPPASSPPPAVVLLLEQ
jgi:hypothetical protein